VVGILNLALPYPGWSSSASPAARPRVCRNRAWPGWTSSCSMYHVEDAVRGTQQPPFPIAHQRDVADADPPDSVSV